MTDNSMYAQGLEVDQIIRYVNDSEPADLTLEPDTAQLYQRRHPFLARMLASPSLNRLIVTP
jgi:hypothetical protein